jgi:nitroreductase
MELFEAIDTRYSYRGEFTDTPVSDSALRRIAEAGIRAPTACNKQGPRFLVVRDPQTLAAIGSIVDRSAICTAKAIIVLLADHRPVYHEHAFGPEDCAAAAQNMLLAITGCGYASVWIDGVLRCDNIAQKLGQLLNVPDHLEVRILLPIGVPAEPRPPTARLPFQERVWFDRCPDMNDA